ncbi:hypothetical protein QTP86_000674 [Hemibagrus guttatus]|nr:hypothetical protein QTP86_000674 [Hemibagrus guttatus]
MEKYRDGQRELHCVFVDLEKAYDRVPREELWYCMRKSGVAEKYVRVVQDMYERSRTVVRCAVGQTEEFKVEVGLHQGLALSPFLFAIVMDQLSEEVRQESPWTMMFADDIVICSESREQVEENLKRWRFALERRGMKVSRSKTEYMCVTEREGSGTVRLQGEEVKKVQEFKYLGSTVQSNGECGKEVKKRVQAGWNGWRKVSGVLCDSKISARIMGKVYRTVVRPAMLYGLETVSLRKRQESELEVAELKMLRFSLGVTRLDRIRNDYIRGTAHVGRLGDKVKEARLRWFGHVQRREKIREAFRVLDRDGNGFISKQELGMAMRSLGYMPSEVELAIIMQRLDMDGDGQVDFDEFMTILGPKLLSSETRDGFLGNTIDSIFWQDLSLNFNLHMRIFTIKTSVFHNNILQQELFRNTSRCPVARATPGTGGWSVGMEAMKLLYQGAVQDVVVDPRMFLWAVALPIYQVVQAVPAMPRIQDSIDPVGWSPINVERPRLVTGSGVVLARVHWLEQGHMESRRDAVRWRELQVICDRVDIGTLPDLPTATNPDIHGQYVGGFIQPREQGRHTGRQREFIDLGLLDLLYAVPPNGCEQVSS